MISDQIFILYYEGQCPSLSMGPNQISNFAGKISFSLIVNCTNNNKNKQSTN